MFVSICFSFAFETALCSPLERIETLVCPISNVLYIFMHCVFCFRVDAREPTIFRSFDLLYHFHI